MFNGAKALTTSEEIGSVHEFYSTDTLNNELKDLVPALSNLNGCTLVTTDLVGFDGRFTVPRELGVTSSHSVDKMG